MLTVYASIGNSDDKLTQYRWGVYVQSFLNTIRRHASQVHGEWYSAPDAPWQNACCCFEVTPDSAITIRQDLNELRILHEQDSIAWAVAPLTEFIAGGSG